MSEENLAVASNPNTSAETLVTLLQDVRVEVRKAFAGNLKIPVEILTTLARDGDENVRINEVIEDEQIGISKELIFDYQTGHYNGQ